MQFVGQYSHSFNLHQVISLYSHSVAKTFMEKPPGKPKLYNIIEWHAVSSDKQKSAGDKLFCVWNGDNYCIPTIPTPIAELNTNLSNVEKNTDEAKDLINEIKEMLPKTKIKDAVIEIEKQIKFAGELLATFNTATGGANFGAKLSQIESGGPSALSRLPTRRPPPEKVKTHTVSVPSKDTDQDDNAQPTQLTYTEETTAMEQNQCPCGLLFNSREDLNTILLATNPVIGTALNAVKSMTVEVSSTNTTERSTQVSFSITVKSVSMAMMKERKLCTTCFINMVLK